MHKDCGQINSIGIVRKLELIALSVCAGDGANNRWRAVSDNSGDVRAASASASVGTT